MRISQSQYTRIQTRALIHILQNLHVGFTLSEEEVILEPTQRLDFLGFMSDMVSMEVRLPGNKLKRICASAQKFLGAESVSERALARIVDKMNPTTQVSHRVPLFFHHLR